MEARQSKRALFVCSGNICRSPMAEALLRARLERDGLGGRVRVSSAGVLALEGNPPSAYAVIAMDQRGLDIRAHRSRQLHQRDVHRADLILCMARQHRDAIRRMYGGSEGRLYLLSEMTGHVHDVNDPYGGSLLVYEHCAGEIASLIEEGCGAILRHLGIPGGRS